VFLLTVQGHVRPISGSGCRGEGPRGSPSYQRAPRVPRARQKYAKRVGRSRSFVARVGRGGSRFRQGAGVGHFDDVTGVRARRKAFLSLGRFSG
jgi:hypothetical protein